MVEKASGPNLFEFEIKASDDPAKDAHELVHEPCGRVLCDVEPGDNLHTLLSVAANHPCDKHWRDSPTPEPELPELRGCMRDGYDAEHVNRVFGKIRDDCGIDLVCVWDLYGFESTVEPEPRPGRLPRTPHFRSTSGRIVIRVGRCQRCGTTSSDSDDRSPST